MNQRVNQKVGKVIDKALDEAEGKKANPDTSGTNESGTEENVSKAPNSTEATEVKKASLSSYSKFDFVPGEKVVFYDDLSKSRLGEFPDFWLTNGMGQQ